MKITSKIFFAIFALIFATSCTTPAEVMDADSMEFTEDEVEGGDEMEFTEEEAAEADVDEMEFAEDELESDEIQDYQTQIIPTDGTWLLTYEPGFVQCGSGPYIEGASSTEESMSLAGFGTGDGFDMQQSGQDRTLNFHVVYSGEFLDPFADNIENYPHPTDMFLALGSAAYQVAFQEDGLSYYMILYRLTAFEMFGVFWVRKGECVLEKYVTATSQ